jgi:hypothetical protein
MNMSNLDDLSIRYKLVYRETMNIINTLSADKVKQLILYWYELSNLMGCDENHPPVSDETDVNLLLVERLCAECYNRDLMMYIRFGKPETMSMQINEKAKILRDT